MPYFNFQFVFFFEWLDFQFHLNLLFRKQLKKEECILVDQFLFSKIPQNLLYSISKNVDQHFFFFFSPMNSHYFFSLLKSFRFQIQNSNFFDWFSILEYEWWFEKQIWIFNFFPFRKLNEMPFSFVCHVQKIKFAF